MTSRPGALPVARIPLALPGDPLKLHQRGTGPGPAKMGTQTASLQQSHLAAPPGSSTPQARPAGQHQRSTTQRGRKLPGARPWPQTRQGTFLGSYKSKSKSRATATTAATTAAVSATAAGVSSAFAASVPRPDPGRTRRHGVPPCPPVYSAGPTNPAVLWPQPGGTQSPPCAPHLRAV